MKVYEYNYIQETVEENIAKTEFFDAYSEMVEFAKNEYFEKNHKFPKNMELKEGSDYNVHDIGSKMEETTTCKTCGKEIPKYTNWATAIEGIAIRQCVECFSRENNPFKELGFEV